jgi:oligosaccharyltransferase complex subunit alpha (ribophorin I)
MAQMLSFVRDLRLDFPRSASDPYFRDSVGNVSTSNFRVDRKKSTFEFQPRFPLFGGWRYSWYHGYNLPLEDFLYSSKEPNKYVLNIPFVQPLVNATIDSAEVRVILPEGAK